MTNKTQSAFLHYIVIGPVSDKTLLPWRRQGWFPEQPSIPPGQSFPLRSEARQRKHNFFFFSDLPAVMHSSVIKLLAKPHPMIETLAETTWRLYTISLFPYCSGMKISHPALFLVSRYSHYSWWSKVLDRFQLNFVHHFCCFYFESDFFFQPVSENYDFCLARSFN